MVENGGQYHTLGGEATSLPLNLALTEVRLFDKPVAPQLAIRKWVRTLVRVIVNKALETVDDDTAESNSTMEIEEKEKEREWEQGQECDDQDLGQKQGASIESWSARGGEAEDGEAWDEEDGVESIERMKRDRKRDQQQRNGGKKRTSSPFREESPLAGVPSRYWAQRYRYFSKFAEGIRLDEEGWYSVTPEPIAAHIARRCPCDVVVDPFAGCGGNAIQFALTCHLVVAVDIDPKKIEIARHNAAIYGVQDRIEFIVGDAMELLPRMHGLADVVFLSPPWGGPGYEAASGGGGYDACTMLPPPLTGDAVFRAARAVTPNVVFFLPRNVDESKVAGLVGGGDGAGAAEVCELERHYLNNKLKTTAAYFGELLTGYSTAAAAAATGRSSDRESGSESCSVGPSSVPGPAPIGSGACAAGAWVGTAAGWPNAGEDCVRIHSGGGDSGECDGLGGNNSQGGGVVAGSCVASSGAATAAAAGLGDSAGCPSAAPQLEPARPARGCDSCVGTSLRQRVAQRENRLYASWVNKLGHWERGGEAPAKRGGGGPGLRSRVWARASAAHACF